MQTHKEGIQRSEATKDRQGELLWGQLGVGWLRAALRCHRRVRCLHCGRGTNYCTIWFKNTPKLRQHCTQKTRHKRRTKLAAALRAAANFGRRGCRVFCVQIWRNFGVVFNQTVQYFVPQQDFRVILVKLVNDSKKNEVFEAPEACEPSQRPCLHIFV